MLNPVYFLMYATGEKVNITQIEGQFPQAPFPTMEERENFIKDWIQVPDEKFKKYLWTGKYAGNTLIPLTPRLKYRRTLSTGRKRCITSMMRWECAPVCRPSR